MKILKYLLFLVFILLVAFLLYVIIQPSKYDVKRSKLIDAPANLVYNQINNIKHWDKWGPWHDTDSTIVTTYSENTIGVGAKSSWTSKDGPGSMELVNTVPDKSVDLKMQFGNYEPTDIYWKLDEVEGGTNVTWGMKNDNNPFMFKLFGVLSGGMDKMLGKMEEDGLNNLEKVVLEQIKNMPKPNYKLSEVEDLELPAATFIGYKQNTSTDLTHEEFTKLYMEYLPKVGAYAASKLKPDAYTPGTYFIKWDQQTKEAEYYIGVLLKEKLAPAEDMTSIDIPAGKAVKISKLGNYGTGDYEAHLAIEEFMKSKNLESNGTSVWELYVNDPTLVKPEEIQTDIYYPIQ